MAISNSYMITNRAYPTEQYAHYIYPVLPPGNNFYFLAPGANNSNPNAYQQVGAATGAMPPSFQSQLEADIVNAVQSGGSQVTLYIHGLAYYLSDACETLGHFGANLAAQGYKGLLIGFSWPSYGSIESYLYYGSVPYSFPPTAVEYGTIRDNIHGSTASLLNLLSQLVPLCKKHGARLDLATHSEGNYMLMLAMYALSSNAGAWPALAGAGRFIDQVLQLAADINNGALQTPQSSPPWAGQGSWIAQYSNAVTVYWSSADDKLPYSDGWTSYHNPSFPLRLGLHGPNSNARGTILPNVYGLDCSLVAIRKNTPPGKSVHESYFYIPRILLDMTQTLGDVPPAQVVNRVSTGNQSFQMTAVPALLEAAFQPRATRLPKEVPPNT
jgi:Alpha/beta hydrolase of unknown function (DUF900)